MDARGPDYSLLNHTADLGMTVRGNDLKTLFEDAAHAMMEIMVKTKAPAKSTPLRLAIEGQDLSDLMVRWLGEILYLFQGERRLPADISIVSLSPHRLEAFLKTVPFDLNLHEILCDIKAVTYHQAEVAQKGNRWQTRIIFDL